MPISELTKAKIIALISVLLPDAKIYLYGSRARGTENEMSDIDLALDASQRLPMKDVGEIRNVMEALSIPYKIDVVDMHAISPEMYQEIMRDKIVWKA